MPRNAPDDRVPNDCPPGDRPRFLADADCREIAARLARYAEGGGYTGTIVESSWTGNVRWARNQISTSGEVRQNKVTLFRDIQGAQTMAGVVINETSDEALIAAARRAERIARLNPSHPESDLVTLYHPEPIPAQPNLWSAATYEQDAAHRAAAARQLMASATAAGMLSAGYIEVSAHSLACITSWGYTRYTQWTWARYSVTVRDPQGTGSGWAGVDWPDWNRIDGPSLSARALEKCLASRNPVAIEPGRYTTILEPQAVCEFVGQLVYQGTIGTGNFTDATAPFNKIPGTRQKYGESMLGERVVDERITISADPMDPDLGFPPFENGPESNGVLMSRIRPIVYHPATWIEHGVLKALSYRGIGYRELGVNQGLPNSMAFRMSGGDTSIAEMIATTKRGLLVTRFDSIQFLSPSKPILCRGYTRDGVWLIENGKIAKPVKNMAFTESVLFALNNVEQLGPPQRVFHPPNRWTDLPEPAIVPPLKVRDFSFTALADAI